MVNKRTHVSGVAGLIALCLVFAGIFYFLQPHKRPADKTLDKAFKNAANSKSNEQFVDTRVDFPDKSMRIVGTYFSDEPHDVYAFYSTTTILFKTNKKTIAFVLDDLSSHDDIYTKVNGVGNSQPSLAVPPSPYWRHFKVNAVPATYSNIAIKGALLDNLKLFGHGGQYVDLIKKVGIETWGNETLDRYTFRLSPDATSTLPGTLGPLVGRIGRDGIIDIWIASSSQIKYIRFQNPSYVATTTISHINESLTFTPPQVE